MTIATPPKLEEFFAAAKSDARSDIADMLDRGMRIDARDDKGRTALMLAAAAGNRPLMQMLLDRRADVNIRDDNGMTALMHAAGAVASFGGKGVLLLLDAGADAEPVSADNKTALSIAESLGRNHNAEMIRTYPAILAARAEAARRKKEAEAARTAANQAALKRLKPRPPRL